jgi:DNA-binding transcriptional regulator YhcF (GntR family)
LGDAHKAFDGAFSIVAFVMNRFIIDHMLRAGRQLTHGDFEALVIWGVLAHQNVAHLMPPGSLPTAILTEKGRLAQGAEGLRSLRLRDIAQITGIPRETVRRKLGRLEADRYVQRVSDGWVVSAERVESDLRTFTHESVYRLLAVADEVMVALEDADQGRLSS